MPAVDETHIQQLIQRPAESLNVELKRWIDPATPSGAAKIVIAALGLRNRNGGYLIIGFDDETLQPDPNAPADPRAAFHVDTIQGLISKYASKPFEVVVGFGARDGQVHPVIAVPEGVTTPVAAKRDLIDGDKFLVREGAVYFRTLSANGTVSTAPAKPADWDDIINICFENKEADLGRFVRRQLAGIDVGSLQDALRVLGLLSFGVGPSAVGEIEEALCEKAERLLDDGEARFRATIAGRQLSQGDAAALQLGSWSAALVLDPPRSGAIADQSFLQAMAASNPNYTGWPAWLDSRGFTDRNSRPRVAQNGWEALIISTGSWYRHFDFQRFDPKGEFYLRRVLQDDLTDKVRPRAVLDPGLVILRVAEAVAVALSFLKALCPDNDKARFGLAFRWTKMNGRVLDSWAPPQLLFASNYQAHDDDVTTCVEVSGDVSPIAIAPIVDQATRPLFALFDGFTMPAQEIEAIVRRLVERRL